MVKDYKGKEYKNYMEMCEEYGITYEMFKQRYIISKWPLWEALLTPEAEGCVIQDHLGYTYESFADMCVDWGISSPAYRSRRLRGWSKDEALETPAIKPGTKQKEQKEMLEILTHLSTMTAEDLLNAVRLYRESLKQTPTLDDKEKDKMRRENLENNNLFETKPRRKTGPAPKKVIDRDGNEFEGLRAACDAYGQVYDFVKHRIFDGWPLQFALEKPANATFEDHLGNVFSSYSAMCKYYEIDKRDFAKRYDAGWSLKDALMLPLGKEPIKEKSL